LVVHHDLSKAKDYFDEVILLNKELVLNLPLLFYYRLLAYSQDLKESTEYRMYYAKGH
jgi:ABC-type Mn2+/Zn2+ transport system ATPase subunit